MKNIEVLRSEQEDLQDLYNTITGTFKLASLQSVKYSDLVRVFGEPSIDQESGDGKVQFEWVIKYGGDKIFTIYDWKTFERNYTIEKLEVWSIGGREKDHEFFEELRTLFNPTGLVL